MTARTRGALALALVSLLLTLTACSGGDDEPAVSPQKALAAAKQKLDDTPGVTIKLSTPKLPSGTNGLLTATGVGTHDPAFEGDIKVAASGITADASVVAVDGVVYAKLPFTSDFQPIDPATYTAPDPADLMKPEGGLSSLLTAVQDPQAGKKKREGKVVVSSFTGTVPGETVASIIPSADAGEDFDASFTVNDDDQLTKAVLTGPFYPKADDVTYTVAFTDYGPAASITKP
jgi:lipoprotein LprG